MTDTAELDDRSVLQLLLHIRERDFSRTLITGREARGGDYCIRLWPEDFEQIVDALSRLTAPLQPEGHNEPCYYCGKPCNSLAGNPNEWPVPLCHADDPGITKWHHTGCVTERLRLTSPPPEEIAGLIERLEQPMWQHYNDGSIQLAKDDAVEDMKQAAAALRSQAAENENIKQALAYREALEHTTEVSHLNERIRELEAELRDAGIKAEGYRAVQWVGFDAMRDRAEKAEAERDTARADRDEWKARYASKRGASC